MRRLCVQVVAIAFACSLPSLAFAGDAVLIEFSSSRCLPCQQMQPVLSELNQSGVAIRTVDVTREPELTQRYGVDQTPTFVIVSGGKELTRLVGKQTTDQLRTALAINPSGPWTDTASKPADTTPMTRLAPLPTSLVPPVTATRAATASRPLAEPMPSLSIANAVQRAQAATVRLRVFDGNGFGAGTGTIIDVHGEEALVLTCGHLFRDTKGQGRIEVDLFISGETRTVEAQLIDYDADVRDIALVAIRPGFAVQPVKIIGTNQLPVSGEAAFSFGCDRGADPSRRDTRVTGVNKYNQDKGASNLEIAGAPIDGRSGGGLFNAQGQLIGVCNAADYEGDVGIYTGPGSVHWQLDRVQLSKLYHSETVDSATPLVSQNLATPTGSSEPWIADNQPVAGAVAPESRPERFASLDGPLNSATTSNDSLALSDESEVIVIVRDKTNPTASARVMTLAQPSPELMHMLQSQAAR